MNDNILWLNKLVPKHVLLKESDIEGKLSPLNITRDQLPKILLKDPAFRMGPNREKTIKFVLTERSINSIDISKSKIFFLLIKIPAILIQNKSALKTR